MSAKVKPKAANSVVSPTAARKAHVDACVQIISAGLCAGRRRFTIPLLVADAIAVEIAKEWASVKIGERVPERFDDELKDYVEGTAALVVSEVVEETAAPTPAN